MAKHFQKCNGRNHLSLVCHKGITCGVNRVTEQTEVNSDDHDDHHDDSSDYEFLAVIAIEPSVETSSHTREIYTGMIVNEETMKFQIDSGASINIINHCHMTGSHNTVK